MQACVTWHAAHIPRWSTATQRKAKTFYRAVVGSPDVWTHAALCMHARTHTHTHTRAHAHTHTHARAHTHTHTHTSTSTHTHTYIHTRARIRTHTHMLCTYTRARARKCYAPQLLQFVCTPRKSDSWFIAFPGLTSPLHREKYLKGFSLSNVKALPPTFPKGNGGGGDGSASTLSTLSALPPPRGLNGTAWGGDTACT